MSAQIVVVSHEPIAFGDLDIECDLARAEIVEVGCHNPRLPVDAAGLLIYGPNESRLAGDIGEIAKAALDAGIPVLASGSGMHALNVALGGDQPRRMTEHAVSTDSETVRRSVFLAPGAKVSSTIGGSGWLTVRYDHCTGINQSGLAPGAMAAAITEDRVIEAFEMPGHRWVIGVQWDIFGATRLPRGFDNVLIAFLERAIGE